MRDGVIVILPHVSWTHGTAVFAVATCWYAPVPPGPVSLTNSATPWGVYGLVADPGIVTLVGPGELYMPDVQLPVFIYAVVAASGSLNEILATCCCSAILQLNVMEPVGGRSILGSFGELPSRLEQPRSIRNEPPGK